MSKKSIYALLVAINNYPSVRPLNGCLNDMNAFHDYLKRQCNDAEFVFNPKILENDAATREAVIAGFQHFTAATEGDVCVLYFSGHGSRIDAPDFWEAIDGKIEAIVCYDACLADKELSCLIYETLKDHNESVHFLAVMDCCHSGSNTRADDGVQIRLSQPNRFPKAIQDYYGYENASLLVSKASIKLDVNAPRNSAPIIVSFAVCVFRHAPKLTCRPLGALYFSLPSGK